jgi:hypothetical protein
MVSNAFPAQDLIWTRDNSNFVNHRLAVPIYPDLKFFTSFKTNMV